MLDAFVTNLKVGQGGGGNRMDINIKFYNKPNTNKTENTQT